MIKHTLKSFHHLLQDLLILFGHFVNTRCHLVEVKIIYSINKIAAHIATNNGFSENNDSL